MNLEPCEKCNTMATYCECDVERIERDCFNLAIEAAAKEVIECGPLMDQFSQVRQRTPKELAARIRALKKNTNAQT